MSHAAKIITQYHHVNGPTTLVTSTNIPYKTNKKAYHKQFVGDDSKSIHKFDDVNSTIKPLNCQGTPSPGATKNDKKH